MRTGKKTKVFLYGSIYVDIYVDTYKKGGREKERRENVKQQTFLKLKRPRRGAINTQTNRR